MFLIQHKITKKYITRNFCTKTLTYTFFESLYESDSSLFLQVQVDDFFNQHDKNDFELIYKH